MRFMLIVCCMLATQLFAGTPLGGLTVALSPDGKTLACAGDTRALYVYDAESLELKSRHWLGANIVAMSFNGSGSRLLLVDSSDTLYIHNSSDWSLVKKVDKIAKCTFNPLANSVSGVTGRPAKLVILNMDDGSEIASSTLPDRVRVQGTAISADGKSAAMMLSPENDANETKVSYSDIPKDLKGLDRVVFQQKNDGKTSKVMFYSLPAGELTGTATTYFGGSSAAKYRLIDGKLVIVNYSNQNATIGIDGSTEIFQMSSSYNYGVGIARDESVAIGGGLGKGSVHALFGGEKVTGFSVKERLPAWPEYYKGFDALSAKGPFYGATSGYRILRVEANGTVTKEVPVY